VAVLLDAIPPILVWDSPTLSPGNRMGLPLSLVMADLSRANDVQQLEDRWCAKLDALRRRYQRERTPEARAEYLRMLREFADIMLRGKRLRTP
jgi:hypothetical protein